MDDVLLRKFGCWLPPPSYPPPQLLQPIHMGLELFTTPYCDYMLIE